MSFGEIENSGLFPFFLILFHEHQWGDLHVYKALFSNLTGRFALTVRRVICRGLHWNTERYISVHRSCTGQLELVFSRTILRMRKSLESKQFLPHYPVGLATPRLGNSALVLSWKASFYFRGVCTEVVVWRVTRMWAAES